MNNEELKKKLQSKHINSWIKLYKDDSDIQDHLFSLYNTHPSTDLEIYSLLYLVMHDIASIPTAHCGEPARFIKYGRGYATFCNKYDRKLKDQSCAICHTKLYEERNKKSKITNIEKYGNAIPQRTDLVKNKVKETNLERYGTESHNSTVEIKEKKLQTCMHKYGVDNVSKIYTSDEKQKMYYDKTGFTHPSKNPEVRVRTTSTNIIRYGGPSPLSSPEVIKKQKETNIERYGVDNYSYTDEFAERAKQTSLDLYGTEYYSQSPKYQEDVVGGTNLERRFESASRNKNLIPQFSKDDMVGTSHTDDFIYECVHCHADVVTPYNSFRKCVCQKLTGYSEGETELLLYIKSILSADEIVITKDRKILEPNELDIYIPGRNLAFEYNGMYWHSTEYKNSSYHQTKVLKCKEQDINLIHIFEDEWQDIEKNKIIKERIKNKLHTSNSVYARKCHITAITNKTSDAFSNEHHIQGSTKASINLGLYHENELLAVMTFGKSRFDKSIEYELIRYCSSGTVVGGASKLLKYFEREYKPTSLISYADMNWSSGNLYDKLGFENIGHTQPGYFYYDPKSGTRISRQRCQKHKLVKAGYDQTLTETQICCDIIGYYKIYDSGNWKFIKNY